MTSPTTRLRIHPDAQLVPEMRPEEYADLLADIEAHGIKTPLEVDGETVLDGRHRLRAAQELQLEAVPVRKAKLNGETALNILVFKTQDEDMIAIANTVKEWVTEKNRTLPEGYNILVWSDNSVDLQKRIRLLLRNGAIGLTLVFCLLWLFLDFRLSFWAAMGIPISLGGGLAIMWMYGATLNMISLFALIMVLGIIVDDAIVVGEAIYVHRRRGDGPLHLRTNPTGSFLADYPLPPMPGSENRVFLCVTNPTRLRPTKGVVIPPRDSLQREG